MTDQDKTKDQLIAELEELRGRVSAAEGASLEHKTASDLLQIAPLGIHECDAEGRITLFVSTDIDP